MDSPPEAKRAPVITPRRTAKYFAMNPRDGPSVLVEPFSRSASEPDLLSVSGLLLLQSPAAWVTPDLMKAIDARAGKSKEKEDYIARSVQTNARDKALRICLALDCMTGNETNASDIASVRDAVLVVSRSIRHARSLITPCTGSI